MADVDREYRRAIWFDSCCVRASAEIGPHANSDYSREAKDVFGKDIFVGAWATLLPGLAFGGCPFILDEGYLEKKLEDIGALAVATELYECAAVHRAAQTIINFTRERNGSNDVIDFENEVNWFVTQGAYVSVGRATLSIDEGHVLLKDTLDRVNAEAALGGVDWVQDTRGQLDACYSFMGPDQAGLFSRSFDPTDDQSDTPCEPTTRNSLSGKLLITFASSAINTPIQLPLVIDGLKRERVLNNEEDNPGLGLTIVYHASNVEATIYIYDKGISAIPDGPESPILHREYQESVESLMHARDMGLFQLMRPISETYYSGATSVSLKFNCGDFQTALFEVTMQSMLCITGHQNHFVKIRILSSTDDYNLREFVDSVGLLLWPEK